MLMNISPNIHIQSSTHLFTKSECFLPTGCGLCNTQILEQLFFAQQNGASSLNIRIISIFIALTQTCTA